MAGETGDKLVVGCGYLGRRVAGLWQARGDRVFALTRGRAEELRHAGLEPIVADVTRPETLHALPRVRTVLYAVGMDRSSGRSVRDVYVGGLANVLDALPPPERFLYVSSTGVYGQDDGSEVDESSPTDPAEESGKVVLEAEQLLRRRLPDAIVLRFAGMYGPGRLIGDRALREGRAIPGNPERWLNLIQIDDGARAVLAAEEKGRTGEVYNVSDGNPVRRGDFYRFLAGLLNVPEPEFTGPAGTDLGRRVSNRKLTADTGFFPTYPGYRDGLRAAFVG
ncbi:MAG TPA: SDR family oxidoreductase [Gemmataceae bacterium]